jgi:hypothetical protein
MGPGQIIDLTRQLGIPGLLIGYIFWLEFNNRKDRLARDTRDAAERKERVDADKDQTQSNLRLHAVLEALKTIIMGGRGNV